MRDDVNNYSERGIHRGLRLYYARSIPMNEGVSYSYTYWML